MTNYDNDAIIIECINNNDLCSMIMIRMNQHLIQQCGGIANQIKELR